MARALVEDQILQMGAVEELHILGAGHERLQLFHIGEEDAGLCAGRAHRFA
jgi:hypothetical protein